MVVVPSCHRYKDILLLANNLKEGKGVYWGITIPLADPDVSTSAELKRK